MKTALHIANKENKALIVDFYVPWCPYCAKLQKEIYPSKKLQAQIKNFVRVRINAEKQPSLAKRYDANAYPTIVLLNSNGDKLDTIQGFVSAPVLKNRLTQALNTMSLYNSMISDLNANPKNILNNYEGGEYYFRIENYQKAHHYFLMTVKKQSNPHKKLSRNKKSKRKKAMYNLAVCSMHLDKYARAVSEWNSYLSKNNSQKNTKAYISARYYRGLSNFYRGNKKRAQGDLVYASKYLEDIEERKMAEMILEMIF